MTEVLGAEPHAPPDENDPREHVLVVDDEPSIRSYTSRVLAEQGFRVHQASDGAEALDFIRARPSALDAVISDIVMPRLNGVELLELLSVGYPGLPVILMSGYGMDQLAARGIAAPCAVLAKPFPPERLVAEVRRCIKERK